MLKEIQIPLTLENVGSEGKLLTDNMVLKIIGVVVLSSFIALLVAGQLGYKLSKIPALIIGLIVFIGSFYFLATNLILNGKQTRKALIKAAKYQTVNTRHFNDIFNFDGNVALHNSGHCSIFVEIVRGTTLGISDDTIVNYYKTIQDWENHLLQLNYSFKMVNIESIDYSEEADLLNKQIYTASKINPKLATNLKKRYDYLKVFMDNAVRGERFIYVIYDITDDTKQFEARIQQLTYSIQHKLIKSIKILTEPEVFAFCSEFYDTPTTDTNVIVDCDDIPTIVTQEKI